MVKQLSFLLRLNYHGNSLLMPGWKKKKVKKWSKKENTLLNAWTQFSGQICNLRIKYHYYKLLSFTFTTQKYIDAWGLSRICVFIQFNYIFGFRSAEEAVVPSWQILINMYLSCLVLLAGKSWLTGSAGTNHNEIQNSPKRLQRAIKERPTYQRRQSRFMACCCVRYI